jgi:hypothetical protein
MAFAQQLTSCDRQAFGTLDNAVPSLLLTQSRRDDKNFLSITCLQLPMKRVEALKDLNGSVAKTPMMLKINAGNF